MKTTKDKREACAKKILESSDAVMKEYQSSLAEGEAEEDAESFIKAYFEDKPVGAVWPVPLHLIDIDQNLRFREVDTEDAEFLSLKEDIFIHGLMDLPQVYYCEDEKRIIALNGAHRITAFRLIFQELQIRGETTSLDDWRSIPVRFVEKPEDELDRIDRQFKSNELRKANSAMATAQYLGAKIKFLGSENAENIKLLARELGMDHNDIRRYLKIFKLSAEQKERLDVLEGFLGKTIIKNSFKRSTSTAEKVEDIFGDLDDKLYKKTAGKLGKRRLVDKETREDLSNNDLEIFSSELKLSQKEKNLLEKFIIYQRSKGTLKPSNIQP